MNWTIRRTLLALGTTGTALVALIGAVAAHSLARQEAAGTATVVTLEALRNHLEGDMMHDGLRADVLDALVAAEWEPTRRAEVEKQVAQHATWFREALQKNANLELSATVKTALADARPALDSYIASAEGIVAAAFANAERGRALLPEFQRASSWKRSSAKSDSAGNASATNRRSSSANRKRARSARPSSAPPPNANANRPRRCAARSTRSWPWSPPPPKVT